MKFFINKDGNGSIITEERKVRIENVRNAYLLYSELDNADTYTIIEKADMEGIAYVDSYLDVLAEKNSLKWLDIDYIVQQTEEYKLLINTIFAPLMNILPKYLKDELIDDFDSELSAEIRNQYIKKMKISSREWSQFKYLFLYEGDYHYSNGQEYRAD